MEPKATIAFNYAVMIITARKIARMIRENHVKGWEYFDMHAGELSEFERAEFEKAVVDAATSMAIQQAG
jgi:hypothetical protein